MLLPPNIGPITGPCSHALVSSLTRVFLRRGVEGLQPSILMNHSYLNFATFSSICFRPLNYTPHNYNICCVI
uniref:Uncharacterized protein n=1 Tax=Cyanophora sudae TaxID=1522369 RepID=A0A873WRW1_9EUKA|nr:hypothetical protein DXZ12_mgp27 [Cyanophora sudae]QPB15083.1 hypothetical protein [Cyanophora sudae]